jgi:hypothetical protein
MAATTTSYLYSTARRESRAPAAADAAADRCAYDDFAALIVRARLRPLTAEDLVARVGQRRRAAARRWAACRMCGGNHEVVPGSRQLCPVCRGWDFVLRELDVPRDSA